MKYSEPIIEKTREYVEKTLQGESSGHDWWHVYRVWQIAKTIGKEEKADMFVVELAALLHDIADWKFKNGDEMAGSQVARVWLESLKVDQGKKLIALSGRAVTLDWYEMTLEQIAREGLPISELILTPDGVSTSVSKAHGVLVAGVSEFNDDDLKTQLFLSGIFPGRQFNWIHHGLTNIPAKEVMLATRPNLRVVPLAEWVRG